MKKIDHTKPFIKTVNALPHAFNKAYWDMGETSYKEELCIAYIEENNMDSGTAEKMLYKCGITKRDNPYVYLWLNKHIEQSMGMFLGITPYGERKLFLIRGF